ncbi:arsenate reductase family protein [Paenibacillus antri]|uniref:Arsenate reductase family protein n=1 Tax=Paenibacillus antri TaxID=2582848 RepID=A0A5R9GAX7_9BACL|nr:arsenate reductase family protein [Paenibacillus antri]TLS51476.1 arsenate reductase family protein [Paenibacillus antri]
MTTVTAYIYPKCSTCRDAMRSLEAKGVRPEKIDLFETPPSKEQLRSFWELSGLPLKKFLNTSGEVYKEMNLKDRIPRMSEDDILELLASNGRLIKRPIVVDGKRITVGFKEEQYKEIWS